MASVDRDEASPPYQTSRRIGASLILFILSAILLLGVQGITLYDRFARTTETGLDNQGWVFAQLEVEAKNFSLALLEAIVAARTDRLDRVTDSEVRAAFDIYYSRVQTVDSVAEDASLDAKVLAQLEQIRQSSQRMAEELDSKDTLTIADLKAMYATFYPDLPYVRKVANAATLNSIAAAEEARENRHWIVGQLQLVLGLVILLMVASVRQAMKVSRSVEHYASETSKVAERLRRTLNASLDAVLIVDSEGRITEHNAALRSILGRRAPAVIVGQEAIGFIAERDKKAVLKLLAELRATARSTSGGIDTAQRINVDLQLAGGKTSPVELSCAVQLSRAGRASFVVFIRDRSQEVAAADVLRHARDKARLDAKAKERFLSVLSHEMRTPLHGVITSLELIRSADFKPDEQGFLLTAAACARSALTQIDDVLALTRNGRLGDPDEPFVPERLVDDIVSEIMPLALERGNRMSCEVTGDAQSTAILAKPRSFKLTVRNLISNAVKYTSNGQIHVSLLAETLPSGKVSVHVSVKDTGMGIDPADHARIFDEFAMVADQGAEQKTGFGLGLAIAKSSVDRLKGQLGLESNLGEGSTFYFSFEAPTATLPDAPALIPSGPASAPPAPATLRQVMIVDDNPVNRALMCEMVKRIGHTPHLAQDGTAAISLAYGRTYDLILMDLSMPGLSGFEATRIIRSETQNSQTRIIALTARDLAECADEVREAGMDGAVQKPITMTQLQDLIVQKVARAPAPRISHRQPVLDGFQEVLGLMGKDMTRKLAEAMLRDSTRALQALTTNPAAPSLDKEVAELAHRAGGSASVLGAARLGELWRSVEMSVKAEDSATLGDLATEIPEAYQLTLEALEQHAIVDGPI